MQFIKLSSITAGLKFFMAIIIIIFDNFSFQYPFFGCLDSKLGCSCV